MTSATLRSVCASRIGLLLCVVGIGGWGNNQVGVNVSHIATWGTGADLDHPIVVNRDNPWFEGWYYAAPGLYMCAEGMYSSSYENSPFAGGFLRTYEFAEYGWLNSDDWQTPIRGDSAEGADGCQLSDEQGQFWWSIRAGNFVPGAMYALALADGQASTVSWYKLDDDVQVVPVVVFAWNNPYDVNAGDEDWQDFRTRALALFDFIPFRGSKTSNWPDDWLAPSLWGWSQFQAENPIQYYDPPDDIWAECGIQFQVVAVFKFDVDTLHADPPCSDFPGTREFVFDGDRLSLVRSVIGTEDTTRLIDELQPVIVDFGWLHCDNFRGKTDPPTAVVAIDRYDTDRSNVVAHELGHVLLGGGHHPNAQNLMVNASTGNGHELDQQQCDDARTVARDFNARFRTYNGKIGRVRPQNPNTPIYPYGEDPTPVSMDNSCCKIGASKGWTSAGACLSAEGEILPDAKCTECCQIATNPPDAEFRPLGDCNENDVILDSECNKVCCQVGAQYQYLSKLKCDATGTIVAASNCGPPS